MYNHGVATKVAKLYFLFLLLEDVIKQFWALVIKKKKEKIKTRVRLGYKTFASRVDQSSLIPTDKILLHKSLCGQIQIISDPWKISKTLETLPSIYPGYIYQKIFPRVRLDASLSAVGRSYERVTINRKPRIKSFWHPRGTIDPNFCKKKNRRLS